MVTKRRWTILACVLAWTSAAAAGCGGDGGGTGGEAGGTTTTTSTTTTTTGSGGCVDASTYADLFTISDTSFCAVAVYTADEPLGFQVPTWGTHKGPLWSVPDTTGGGEWNAVRDRRARPSSQAGTGGDTSGGSTARYHHPGRPWAKESTMRPADWPQKMALRYSSPPAMPAGMAQARPTASRSR